MGLIIHLGSSAVVRRMRGGDTHRVPVKSVPTYCPPQELTKARSIYTKRPAHAVFSVIRPRFAFLPFLPTRQRREYLDTPRKQPVKYKVRLFILSCGRALGICHQASAPASGSWLQCRDRIAPITLAEIVIFDSPSVFGFLVCC